VNNIRNHTQLIGYLGKDAEIKQLPNGSSLANVSLATNEVYRNKNGDRIQNTHWHRLVGWGKMAELMEQFFKKGREIAITGKLTYNTYEDKKGQTRTFSQVVVSQFSLMGKSGK